ncbi:MAG: M15 family metallopeptidase [Oscillospiraceae bacterium]|nr:M15 family metallopeptidase [Oscillospiraceae bacterium]
MRIFLCVCFVIVGFFLFSSCDNDFFLPGFFEPKQLEHPTAVPGKSDEISNEQESHPAHYIPKNAERYTEYISKYTDIPYETAIAYVNAGVDCKNIFTVDNPDSILVLLNKSHALPMGFIPKKLNYISGTEYRMTVEAAHSFEQMRNEMAKQGLALSVQSAYRSYSRQASLFGRELSQGDRQAHPSVSGAGHSEHQTGLAVDVLHQGGFSRLEKAEFEATRQYQWMIENAHKYGYILRYPEGLEHITGFRFEPWHWRYVGAKAAEDMRKHGISAFEEYWGRYLVNP